MRILPPLQMLDLFRCSCSEQSVLRADHGGAICSSCGRHYPVRENILEFVDPDRLDSSKAKELKGNTFDELSDDLVQRLADKDKGSDYYAHFHRCKVALLTNKLDREPLQRIASLGSGAGFELKMLLKSVPLEKTFSSDLSFQKVQLVPYTLREFDTSLCLFTADLDVCPIKDQELPLLIYEALHHTPDLHAALEKLLRYDYRNLFLVEPCTNFLIRFLARFGIVQRIEYSGVRPDFLDIREVRKLCRTYGYTLSVTTMWEFPEDYFRRLIPAPGLCQDIFLFGLQVFSLVTRPFNFGSMAVIHLRRKTPPNKAH